MSGKIFECGYGAILQEDADVLNAVLGLLVEARLADKSNALHQLRICEIGTHDGGTARGIERFLTERGFDLLYWGIDPDDGKTRPRHVPARGTMIIGDSSEEFHEVPENLDLVWVDGCHCKNHVVLDTVNFAPKVRPGGFICYHDVNPACQGWGYQYHGPKDVPEFCVMVNAALEAIRFPWPGWSFFAEGCPNPKENIDCGTRAYRRDRA